MVYIFFFRIVIISAKFPARFPSARRAAADLMNFLSEDQIGLSFGRARTVDGRLSCVGWEGGWHHQCVSSIPHFQTPSKRPAIDIYSEP